MDYSFGRNGTHNIRSASSSTKNFDEIPSLLPPFSLASPPPLFSLNTSLFERSPPPNRRSFHHLGFPSHKSAVHLRIPLRYRDLCNILLRPSRDQIAMLSRSIFRAALPTFRLNSRQTCLRSFRTSSAKLAEGTTPTTIVRDARKPVGAFRGS